MNQQLPFSINTVTNPSENVTVITQLEKAIFKNIGFFFPFFYLKLKTFYVFKK